MALVYQLKDEFRSYDRIAGIDEAGRGPWAGPVVAAAVILPHDYHNDLIDDSKKLSPRQRDIAFEAIRRDAIAIGVGIVSSVEIDQTNILSATKRAMKEAIDTLSVAPDLLMIDAVKLNEQTIPQVAIIHGDALALPIAAASIIAKVTRDRLMEELHRQHPAYRFDLHKGYGTKLHLAMIEAHGPLEGIHRMSFRPLKK